MTILDVKNLSSSYEGQPLLKEITFSLKKGEILCLLGPSGAGKTTLLRLLAGLEAIDGGSVTFNNLNILPIPSHKRNFGLMFQEYALFPHKNVFENVSFGLEMKKIPPMAYEEKVTEMLEIVGLKGFAHRTIDELSGGERQRVALARSLAPEPRLLLLDEPLGSLDRTLRDRLAAEIRSILKALNVTALFVTHDQSEAFSVADKVAILYDGRLEQFDSPENIYRTPANATVARFLSFKNIIYENKTKGSLFYSAIERLHPASGNGNEGNRTLLIRPEGARITQPEGLKENEIAVTGKIINRQFQGATYKLQIEVDGQMLFFDLSIDPVPPGIGDPVHLAVGASALVLLAQPLS